LFRSLPFYYLNWYVVRCDSALQHHSTKLTGQIFCSYYYFKLSDTSDLKKNKYMTALI
ncbi:hypothetical protein T4D_3757, partial [Trichinella pseudospiralis]